MDHSANVCHLSESHTSPFSNPFSKDHGTSVKFKQISLDFSDRIREHLIYGPLNTCTWNSVMMKLETILNKCQLRLQLELTRNWVVSVLCTLCSCVWSAYQVVLIFYRTFQHLLLLQRKNIYKNGKVLWVELISRLKFKR